MKRNMDIIKKAFKRKSGSNESAAWSFRASFPESYGKKVLPKNAGLSGRAMLTNGNGLQP